MATTEERIGESEEAERRAIHRWLRRESASVQVMQPASDGSYSPRVLAVQTADVSLRGMRLLANQALEAGYFFDVCVELRGHPQRFLLTGEIRWCRPLAAGEGFEIGLEIHEGEGTDYQYWAERINAVCHAPDPPPGAAGKCA